MHHLKLALRQLVKSPDSAAVAVLSLGIGIGLHTTIYSVLDAVFLRPLGFDRPGEIVRIEQPSVAYLEFEEFARRTQSLAGLTARSKSGAVLRTGQGVDLLMAENVAPNFFEVLGVRTGLGRLFAAHDRAGTRAVVISETMARQFWPEANPVGQTIMIRTRASLPHQIVGIATDVSDQGIGTPPTSFLYLSSLQHDTGEATLIVEPRGDLAAATAAVRREMAALNPRVPPLAVESMNGLMRFALFPQWAGAWLAGALGGLAFLLAVAGLYSLVAYSVAHRTREIGIRMTLGAQPGDALRAVQWQALRLTLPGLALGLPLAVAAGFALRSLLHGVSPVDPLTLAGVALVAIGVVLIASCFPARRAARVNPVEALRSG